MIIWFEHPITNRTGDGDIEPHWKHPTSKLAVDISLLELASLLLQFGQPLVAGDAEVFRRMSAEVAASL